MSAGVDRDMDIGIVQVGLVARARCLPGIRVWIVIDGVAAGEDIVGSVERICAAKGDRRIKRHAGRTVQESGRTHPIRDPVSLSAAGRGHDTTLDLESTGISIWSGPCAHHVGKLCNGD